MSKVSLPKDKIKILLLEGLHQSALDTFQSNGYHNIESLKTSLPEDELIEKIILAPSREELVHHTHALDRILKWNFYSPTTIHLFITYKPNC